jgi:hypothetical protein
MKSFFVLLIVIGATLHSTIATAQKSRNLRADRIQISYVPPKNPAHESIFRLLKERQVLERFKEFLSPFRLPRALLLKLDIAPKSHVDRGLGRQESEMKRRCC